MPNLTFDDAVSDIVASDPRYHRDAYSFLRDALDFTMREIRKAEEEERHVSGPELLHGFKDYALDEFGPLARQVLDDWGVRSCEDVGNMVFNLIEEGVFGRSDEDRIEDFIGVFDFADVFDQPFLPSGRGVRPGERRGGKRAPDHGCGSGTGGNGGSNKPAKGAADDGDPDVDLDLDL